MGARFSPAKPPVLLFVGDDYDWAYMFCQEFQKSAPHWHIIRARDGWSAMLQLAKGSVPEALVIDVSRKGVGCRDLIEWVKDQAIFRALPVVVYSGIDDPSHRKHCTALGVNSYLDKPTSPEELTNHIQTIARLTQASCTFAQDETALSGV